VLETHNVHEVKHDGEMKNRKATASMTKEVDIGLAQACPFNCLKYLLLSMLPASIWHQQANSIQDTPMLPDRPAADWFQPAAAYLGVIQKEKLWGT
jgi:hypothetical protein